MRSNRVLLNLVRKFSQGVQGGPKPTPTAAASAESKPNVDVPGLSSKCVRPASGQLGPGASKTGDYKVPEYFCYDRMSYYEAEIEMAKYRCPQPSATE